MDRFSWQRSRSSEKATCPICLEELTDRRRLPCRHSFCRRCLERHCENKCPGDDSRCPLCRTIFQIPRNGLDEFRDSRDGRGGEKICEVCSTELDVKRATVYCVDCSQLLCERCSLPHKKMRKGAHSLIPLAESGAHGQEGEECETSRGPVVACREAIIHVETESKEFLDSVKKTKQQVKERGDEVKRVVDGHVKDLLDQVEKLESDTMKAANALTGTLKMALLTTLGSEDLSAQLFAAMNMPRTEELVMTCIEASCYSAPEVAFIPRDIEELLGNERNTVGSVLNITNPGK